MKKLGQCDRVDTSQQLLELSKLVCEVELDPFLKCLVEVGLVFVGDLIDVLDSVESWRSEINLTDPLAELLELFRKKFLKSRSSLCGNICLPWKCSHSCVWWSSWWRTVWRWCCDCYWLNVFCKTNWFSSHDVLFFFILVSHLFFEIHVRHSQSEQALNPFNPNAGTNEKSFGIETRAIDRLKASRIIFLIKA